MNNTAVRAAFSFDRQVRFFFAGRYFYAYSYYFGNENRNLTRPVDC